MQNPILLLLLDLKIYFGFLVVFVTLPAEGKISSTFFFFFFAGNDANIYIEQILKFHQRLSFLQEENKKRSLQLSNILNKIKCVTSERKVPAKGLKDNMNLNNLGFSSVNFSQFNSLYYYLPHLRGHENNIYPNIIFGKNRTGASVVIGIPTIKREKENYLMETLDSLFSQMSKSEEEESLVIVFVAEVDETYINTLAQIVKNRFPPKVNSGVLEMISPPAFYYPSFLELKLLFGDSEKRVRWRTKQNLDYSFLMLYAQDKGKFYLQLEDDIVVKPKYFMAMKDFAVAQTSDWLVLEFSKLGFIGKLFKTKDLPFIVQFFIMFYKDKPIDWLLDHLLYVKICNPERDNVHCEKEKQKLRIRFKPSLFQHIGKYSSLPGKIQNLEDADFEKNELYLLHSNPPASLFTSLKAYENYSLEKAYFRRGIFWALSPKAGDYILMKFSNPLKIKEYVFISGNIKHPGDKLFNTNVEILPENATDFLSNSLRNGSKWDYEATDNGFFKIGCAEFRHGKVLISSASTLTQQPSGYECGFRDTWIPGRGEGPALDGRHRRWWGAVGPGRGDPRQPHDGKAEQQQLFGWDGEHQRNHPGSDRLGWPSPLPLLLYTPAPLRSPEGRGPRENRRVSPLAHAPLADAAEWPAATLVLRWGNQPLSGRRPDSRSAAAASSA
ncbi:alpha-1,3-mannosyl-glycoprotein 4-beta-N-acetylglucosaminyltransferase-like protein MGAT4D [Gracilinanus agilis]|uniref:alpha-1,3-mannosyl-glycoprotein 4-beta-N-acetylglucosaminyltransferase-like protein MGAT4D n=1 Tax=Gracilinanus agilis TaxID=191870 RepID=UPI001CFCB662|nr:alpha-1,3-mannosyl-glycoprotein 4-beta-N-acetylglucosaminyltransferase-like protein MGAT4D [Gracilinanus agilis]